MEDEMIQQITLDSTARKATAKVATVNALLRKAGIEAKLYAGRGYYYWSGEGCLAWPSVYIYRMDQVDMGWMVDEINDNLKYHSF